MKAVFCDMYNFTITGDISSNLNAASCDSPTHSGPSLLILNDQGGDVMNISDDITSTLRAQDHGHPPVVCFGECNNRAYISEKTMSLLFQWHCFSTPKGNIKNLMLFGRLISSQFFFGQ